MKINKIRLVFASSLAAYLNAIFVTAVTIAGELNESFEGWLKSLSGHHWTSKGILSVTLYLISLVLFYLVFKKVDSRGVRTGIFLAVLSAAAGSLIILAFFTGHNFGWI